ncbi:MAG: gliding motility-associated-like protein [Polaribacter sp.]|jgi:gliding motility-associated-like protein
MKENFMRILLTLTLLLSLSLNGLNTCLAAESLEAPAERTEAFIDSTIVNVADTVLLTVLDCTLNAPLCVDLPIAEIPSYQLIANGAPYNLGFLPCDIDTTTEYYYNLLSINGPYNLVSWNVNITNVATNNSFADLNELVALLNMLDPAGNWVYNPPFEISGGSEMNSYSDMVIYQVAELIPITIAVQESYEAMGTQLNFPVGETEFVIIESISGTSDTFNVNVACIQNDTVNLSFLISDSSVECFDLSQLPGTPVSSINVCPALAGFATNSLFINGDSCLLITTISGGTDVYCVEVCDDLGFCDTTTYIVNVNVPGTPGTNSIDVDLLLGSMGITCINTGVLLPNAVDTIYNICPDASGGSVGLFIDEDTYCINYNGFNVGQDTACIVICDAFGICDTTFINFNVQSINSSFYYDTVYLNTTTLFCDFDLSELPGTLTTVTNGCAGNTGGFIDFMLNPLNNCVSYEGLAVGKDTACIYLTDDLGNQDTLLMVVCASEPTIAMISDTIRLETVSTNYCPDSSQLGGVVSDTVFFCDPLPANLTLTPTVGAACFDVAGTVVGTEEICVYICDDLGFCDTTIYQITVTDDIVLDLPTLNGDSDTLDLSLSNSIVINVCDNDIIPGNTIDSITIISLDDGGIGPTNGTAVANNDCTVTYTPDPGYCGSSDAYTYQVCNSTGCATAFVNVYVECAMDELKIFNAFSPNGDGVNDFWKIEGIEGFPENVVTIFNRWGNEIFKLGAYNNDVAWGGDWEGTDLPDGIYYYLIDYGNEAGDQASGWVVISR